MIVDTHWQILRMVGEALGGLWDWALGKVGRIWSTALRIGVGRGLEQVLTVILRCGFPGHVSLCRVSLGCGGYPAVH